MAAPSQPGARNYRFADSDPIHLTPDQITEEIKLTEITLTKNYLQGVALENLARAHPDFARGANAPTRTELSHDLHPNDYTHDDALRSLRDQTNARVRAAMNATPPPDSTQ